MNPEERREKQDVLVNIAAFADFRKACRTDRFEDAVDYCAVKKEVLALVESSSFYLIEALAESIAQTCLARPLVRKVQVRVEKPSALRFAHSVGVEVTRERRR